MNWWFIAASVVVLLPVLWLVTTKIAIPRLGAYQARDDVDVRTAALKLLPPRSPKRAAVVADLERLEAELTA